MPDPGVLDELPILRFLPDETRAQIVRRFVPETFPFGGVLAAEGEAVDALYVLVSGRARVVKRTDNDDEVPLNVLQAGDSFGEAELFQGRPHPTTVRAASDVLALRLDRSAFQDLVDTDRYVGTYLELQLKHNTLRGFFRDFPAFARLPTEAMVGIVLAELEPKVVAAGETVVAEGDPAGPLHLIEEGRVRVMRQVNGAPQYLGSLGSGQYFGEESALTGSPRRVTVEAITPCRFLLLGADTVQRLADGVPEFRQRLEERIAQYRLQDPGAHARGHRQGAAAGRRHGTGAGRRVAGRSGRRRRDTTDQTPFEDEGRFIKRRRRVRRMRFVRQIDEMDCGAACLAMVARHFGRAVSLARIRQLVNTGLDGTSLRSLCSAAEELGLAARSVKASLSNLERMPLPAICHWDGDHWLLLYHVTRRHVYVADPALGFRRLPREEFERRWTGYAALFDYTTAFEQGARRARAVSPGCGRSSRRTPGSSSRRWALAVVVSALQMVLPVFTQVIVDRVLVEQDLSLLRLLIVAMGATMLFIVASLLAQRYLLSFVAVRVDAAGLDYITRRLLALPMTYFATRRTGDLQRRIEGIRQVRDVHGAARHRRRHRRWRSLRSTVALMSVYSPWLTLVFLATAPLYGLLMFMAVKWLRPTFYDLEDAYGRYHSYQVDAIKGIETVKAVGGEPMFRQLMLGAVPGRGAQAVSRRLRRHELRRRQQRGHVPRHGPVPVGGRARGARRPARRSAAWWRSTRCSPWRRCRFRACCCSGTACSGRTC